MKYVILWLIFFTIHSVSAQEIPGLTARWTMNSNCGLIDEVSGSPANGVLVDVSLTTDRGNHVNAALSFSSNTSYITLGAIEKLKLAADKSITFWINPVITGTNRTGTVLSYGTGFNIRYEEQASLARLNIMFGNISYMQLSLTPNQWQSVAVTFFKDFIATKSKAFCYIGGAQVAASEQNKSAHSFDKSIVLIGPSSQSTLTNGFRGKLDDMRVYDRALTGAEVMNIALPVKLTFFKGKKIKGAVELSWKTHLEENVSHFFLQKSLDGQNFQQIKKVEAGKFNYLEYDLADIPALFAWYRLQIVDRDGVMQFSNVIRVSANDTAEETPKIFPNPASKYLNVTGINGNRNITITNSSGKTVIQKQLLPGNAIDVSKLVPGLYYIIVSDGNNRITSKFVKQ